MRYKFKLYQIDSVSSKEIPTKIQTPFCRRGFLIPIRWVTFTNFWSREVCAKFTHFYFRLYFQSTLTSINLKCPWPQGKIELIISSFLVQQLNHRPQYFVHCQHYKNSELIVGINRVYVFDIWITHTAKSPKFLENNWFHYKWRIWREERHCFKR